MQISACNGRNCGDTYGPINPNKPVMWAEDWTAQLVLFFDRHQRILPLLKNDIFCFNCFRFRVFGDPPSQRSAEDLAYGGARFFSVNGTIMNYYMVLIFMVH